MSKEITCCNEIQKMCRLTYVLEKTAFKLKGISSSQAHTILMLLENEPISIKKLSEKLVIDCSTMSRNITKLIEKEWVKKVSCPKDKRVNYLKLTEKGREKAREIKKESIEHFKKIVCQVPKEDREMVFKGVKILIDIIEKGAKKG